MTSDIVERPEGTEGRTEIVAVDVGGTNARFARAWVAPGKRPILGPVRRYKATHHASLESAWTHFRADDGGDLPRCASIAVAAALGGDIVKLTNSPWSFRPAALAPALGVDRLHLLNDFGAMAHAVAVVGDGDTLAVAGPDRPFPEEGPITVIGPGTGLGVALLLKRDGHAHVIETEGGHVDFAPLDPFEARMADRLRERYLRVSAERVVSGPGLSSIHEAIAAFEGAAIVPVEDATLWQHAIDGSDPLAARALQRFVMSYGSVAGDLALAHGAVAVALVGGLSSRLRDHLVAGFGGRFGAKGRWQSRMESLPVRLVDVDEPGLLGAAAGFAADVLARGAATA